MHARRVRPERFHQRHFRRHASSLSTRLSDATPDLAPARVALPSYLRPADRSPASGRAVFPHCSYVQRCVSGKPVCCGMNRACHFDTCRQDYLNCCQAPADEVALARA